MNAQTTDRPAPPTLTQAPAPEKLDPHKLDDVMLAMDVVDTIRHRENIAERELGAEQREAALIDRLRDIYAAQGIEVPDRILRDGVKALEEKRFVYEPPAAGVSIALAKAYVGRDRWMKPLGLVLALALFVTALYEFGFEAPRERAEARAAAEISQTLPAALDQSFQQAMRAASTEEARLRLELARRDGLAALARKDAKAARAAIADLAALEADAAAELSIRIVSRPGEYSGVFRIPDDTPSARNFYLIVEAVDARGRSHALEISSEEDQATRRVAQWGVRVPEAAFNRVSADKADDQIIQNALVGRKPRGALAPTYDIDGARGAILEW